ncbi:hypothetical protein XENOCAPTIV_011539 [Xenoophorus captivus]|uniref:Uncharacterized protein n=1 Tax=Xenoophorus captivus TaxID=1517983 RepID=A0ABV0Q9F0_9TELE
MNYRLGPAQPIPGQTGESAQLSSNKFFNELQTQAAEFSRGPEGTRGSPVVPEVTWVWLKVIRRKWQDPRFTTGSFQVLERTSHAVCLRGKGETWGDWSQCAPAEEPTKSQAPEVS